MNEYEMYPKPMLAIENALRLYGGWSRIFARSSQTYDAEHVIYRESEVGFWVEYAKVLADEQFRKEVDNCYEIFVETYGRKGYTKVILKQQLAKALIQEGWKPIKTRILAEVRRLRREKRDDIRTLKQSLKRRP